MPRSPKRFLLPPRQSTPTYLVKVLHGIPYGSTDQIYAVSLNQVESPEPVALTFRHAMSRIAIMLSSTSNRYSIEMRHVLLNNIALSGDFTLPEKNTSESETTGTWSNLSKPAAALTMTSMVIPYC